MTSAKKSQILRTITLLIATLSLSLSAHAKYDGGTGEPNELYRARCGTDWREQIS